MKNIIKETKNVIFYSDGTFRLKNQHDVIEAVVYEEEK